MADIDVLLIAGVIIGIIFLIFYLQGLCITIGCVFSSASSHDYDYFDDCARAWTAVVKLILYVFGLPLTIMMIYGLIKKEAKWLNYWIIVAVIISLVSLIISIVIYLTIEAPITNYIYAIFACVLLLVLIYIVYLNFKEIGGGEVSL